MSLNSPFLTAFPSKWGAGFWTAAIAVTGLAVIFAKSDYCIWYDIIMIFNWSYVKCMLYWRTRTNYMASKRVLGTKLYGILFMQINPRKRKKRKKGFEKCCFVDRLFKNVWGNYYCNLWHYVWHHMCCIFYTVGVKQSINSKGQRDSWMSHTSPGLQMRGKKLTEKNSSEKKKIDGLSNMRIHRITRSIIILLVDIYNVHK